MGKLLLIIGSSAGALIGLQFVVLAFIAEKPPLRAEADAAFSTPSVVHFGVVLLLSAIVSAPWNAIVVVAIVQENNLCIKSARFLHA